MLRGPSSPTLEIQPFDVDEEDDDVSDDDIAPEDITFDDRCPIILLSKEEKKRMRKPWRNSLIIKMFDGNLGYMGLMRRLKKKWNLKGELALTDIGCKYFIARFTNSADYNYVLTQGPWMLDDNYLTIRKWVPNFVPDDAPIKVLTAWVRIPNISVEYFDVQFLNKIGSKIGKVLRVDKSTAQADRGQFTRLSVEIDLTQPLLSKFWLKGKIWRVQYEGIRMVCFKCGTLGHNEEVCPLLRTRALEENAVKNINDQLQNTTINNSHTVTKKPEEEEDFGSWMLVKKPIRKRPPRQSKANHVAGKLNNGGAKVADQHGQTGGNSIMETVNTVVAANQGIGSRFSILRDQDCQVNTTISGVNNGVNLENNVMTNEEETSFDTVDLGIQSQNNLGISNNSLPFNLGKKSWNNHNSTSSKTTSKVYQAKKKATLQDTPRVLSDVNLNATLKPPASNILKPIEGKENSLLIFKAHTKATEIIPQNFEQQLPPTQNHDVSLTTPPTQCDQSEDPPEKNSVCRTSNGETILLHNEPPDPHTGSSDRLVVGANINAPGAGSNIVTAQ